MKLEDVPVNGIFVHQPEHSYDWYRFARDFGMIGKFPLKCECLFRRLGRIDKANRIRVALVSRCDECASGKVSKARGRSRYMQPDSPVNYDPLSSELATKFA